MMCLDLLVLCGAFHLVHAAILNLFSNHKNQNDILETKKVSFSSYLMLIIQLRIIEWQGWQRP